jgi:hypothetical protein
MSGSFKRSKNRAECQALSEPQQCHMIWAAVALDTRVVGADSLGGKDRFAHTSIVTEQPAPLYATRLPSHLAA